MCRNKTWNMLFYLNNIKRVFQKYIMQDVNILFFIQNLNDNVSRSEIKKSLVDIFFISPFKTIFVFIMLK